MSLPPPMVLSLEGPGFQAAKRGSHIQLASTRPQRVIFCNSDAQHRGIRKAEIAFVVIYLERDFRFH
jgi:hypothetical protein